MNLRDSSIMIGSMFAVLLTVTVIAFATELSKHADPCEWVSFDICHIKTGSHIDALTSTGHKTTGNITVRLENVIEVVPLSGDVNCVLLLAQSAHSAAVIGTYDEVMLKLNPPECKK